MNVIELAREAGFKVDWQHADVAEIKAQRYVAFANAVIKAHEAKLIEGVGEPIAWLHENAVGLTYYRKHRQGDEFNPVGLYTASQVEAAVAKKVSELEAERDMWRVAAEAVVDVEKTEMRCIIAALEAENDRLSAHMAELRDLHSKRITELEAQNKALVEACKYIVGCSVPMTPQQDECWIALREALALVEVKQ